MEKGKQSTEESFYKPVSLTKEPHYEDDPTNEDLLDRIPRLRKQVLVKDAEIRRNKLEAEHARLQREMLEKEAGTQNKNNKIKNFDVADMGITYDHNGKVLRVKPTHDFGDLEKYHHVDSVLREDLTEIQASEAKLTLERIKK